MTFPRLFTGMTKKVGMKPGSVVYVGEARVEEPVIDVMEFDVEGDCRAYRGESVDACLPLRDSAAMSWINVSGVHRVELVERLGQLFGINPLVLEDIVNTGQRPKFEAASDQLFVVAKMIYRDRDSGHMRAEQVSAVFGERWLITFQERPGDVFDTVRKRIRASAPRNRFTQSDYLAYALLDAVVDHYYVVLEDVGEQVEALEEQSLNRPGPELLATIRSLKRDLVVIRKAVWPMRESISAFDRSDASLIHEETHPYLRDLYEHIVQIMDTVETYREMVSGLIDLYLSSASHHMNEVMKVLTIIATIFIPLGFLAGVYGMNFETDASPYNLPELGWSYGYLSFWLAAVLIAGGLVWYFRRRGWLGRTKRETSDDG